MRLIGISLYIDLATTFYTTLQTRKNKTREEKKSVMDKVCAVIDLEGFHLKSRGGFHVRELGFCDWKRYLKGTRAYETYGVLTDLPKEDRKTAVFVMTRIHGLPYSPAPQENARPSWEIDDDVRAIYQQCKTRQRDHIGYKGGHVEKDLLQRLGIPSHNLEDDGCPPFRQMTRLPRVRGCGHHQEPRIHHCPMVECEH